VDEPVYTAIEALEAKERELAERRHRRALLPRALPRAWPPRTWC
jgi:hypothetical protein